MSEQTFKPAAAAEPINQISPIPDSVAAVVHLYHEHLCDVTFPDVDAAALAEAVAEVEQAERAEQAAREALARARAEQAERDEALFRLAQRALAYARIYAEGQPELAEFVDAISLRRRRARGKGAGADSGASTAASALEPAKGARRRRKKKAQDDDDEQASLLRAI